MNFLKNFTDFFQLDEAAVAGSVTPFPMGWREGEIPVYNQLKIKNFPSSRPEALLKPNQVIEACQILLRQQEEGVVDEILITADVPTQGKNAPQYLIDELTSERKRLRDKILSRFGGRIEASDYPTVACEKCQGTGKIMAGGEEIDCATCNGKGSIREEPQKTDIFVDVEYILSGVEAVDGNVFLTAFPFSKKDKIKRNPGLESYYKTFISPKQVLEISFDPY
jgi:hypothetical protein